MNNLIYSFFLFFTFTTFAQSNLTIKYWDQNPGPEGSNPTNLIGNSFQLNGINYGLSYDVQKTSNEFVEFFTYIFGEEEPRKVLFNVVREIAYSTPRRLWQKKYLKTVPKGPVYRAATTSLDLTYGIRVDFNNDNLEVEEELLTNEGFASTFIQLPGSMIKGLRYKSNEEKNLFYSMSTNGTENFELWKSTETGVELIKEINPVGSSFPTGFTLVLEDIFTPIYDQEFPIEGLVFFMADDGTHGSELWATDGSEENTYLVKDINPGELGSLFGGFTAMGTKVYFKAWDGIHGDELWVSDGSEEGTYLLKDINPNAGNSQITGMSLINDDLIYFSATNGEGNIGLNYELWRTDGTEVGTYMIKDINPNSEDIGSNPSGFTQLGDYVLFSADDGTTGSELWITDGTEEGTHLLKDINIGEESSFPGNFIEFQDQLYFTAIDVEHGRELWRTDGTEAGTEIAFDIWPGEESGLGYVEFVSLDTRLFFQADNGQTGIELFYLSTEPSSAEDQELFPEKFHLSQNYPNPFNPSTVIKYSIAGQQEFVTLKVFDVLGREIATLVNKKQSPGNYSVTFDASEIASGVYFYQLTAGKAKETKKMILSR
ncbi:MAG: T9SS type A sorting domain-containing protein [Melioribacteraceae bacterium]|nr:T9SS type A sorting domain-containing protein [Melioribacteraceae bacterium]